MKDELPTIDLDALVLPVARVTLDGTPYDVLPIQGDAITLFAQVAADNRARVARGVPETEEEYGARALSYLDIGRRIVYCVAPSIPRARVDTMIAAQLTAIAELAADPVRRVQAVMEQAEGKGSGPA